MTTNPETDQRGARPREVETAFLLLLAAIAVDALVWTLDTFVVSPSGFDDMRDEMGGSNAIQQAAMSAGFLIATSGLLVYFVFQMRQGRNWARYTLAAVAALVALFMINSMSMNGFTTGSTADVIYDIAIGTLPPLLVAGAVLLMFLPTANRYFSTPKGAEERGI
ncbi:hypothetical protein [Streptomyces sp. NP-1717]|uniref:hypothetical protein n=1 Tax=Streptomyces sp. NP-1717 TaxID=2704470 RepID=UPI001F5D9909|nr:hypothetical protein [Streptomyces sp. NP-1717]MCI3220772.1 hypothetical protein [Streptomyces sp. NP-1717]